MMDLRKITCEVKKIALETGAFLRVEREAFDASKVEKKHAHDYVSYVDRESERLIVGKLHELLPEAGFIAEEGSGGLQAEEYCWLVDPLDGTTNFIHSNAPYCISIALRDRKELLVGVVYEVCRDELYWTCKGEASYLNDRPIRVSQVSELTDAFIALGLPYNSDAYRPMAEQLLHALYGHVGGLRIQGAAAVELCYVASGRFDARVEAFLGPWDIAAGALILMNAGGQVTDFGGSDDFYSGHQVLATNGKLHQALIDVIRK